MNTNITDELANALRAAIPVLQEATTRGTPVMRADALTRRNNAAAACVAFDEQQAAVTSNAVTSNAVTQAPAVCDRMEKQLADALRAVLDVTPIRSLCGASLAAAFIRGLETLAAFDAAQPKIVDRDPAAGPCVGDELPLSDVYLSSVDPDGTLSRFSLMVDSQDVRDVLRSIGLAAVRAYLFPQDVSGAIVVQADGEYSEVWLTDSSRPFDLSTACYVCVVAP